MYTTSLLSFLALSCLSSQLVSALPTFDEPMALDPRAQVCNADNCLRAVRVTTANLAPASSFCQSYLHTTPVSTVTSYTTIISTPAAPTVTSVIGTTTQTVGIQCTSTSTLTQYLTSTSTDIETASTTVYVKRAVTTPLSAAISSACPSANGLAQSSRISSACSCFLGGSASTSTALTTSTVHTTAATLPAVTVTSHLLKCSKLL